jgi:polysaccharide chain length determinant protein (PEP-CTERM system associated)
MLPGKKLRPEDLLQILRRRFWWLVVPFAVIAAGTAAVARKLPDSYRSQAVIQVVPQRVPENYVRSTVTTKIEDRLQSIKEQILSRTRLEQIIQQFNLYSDLRRTEIMENIVEKMRRDIQINVLRGGDSFNVAYIGENARTVMNVTAQLATLFIDESLRDREVLAEGTDQFLEAQLEDARHRLMDHEKKLADYRLKFSGQLPTQQTANLQALANTQMQLQQLAQAYNRDSDRRLAIENALQELENGAAAVDPAPVAIGPIPGGTPETAPLRPTVQTLDAAKKALEALRQRYSPEWPDVQTQKRYVEDLQRKVDAEALQQPLSVAAANPPVATSPEQTRRKRIEDLKAQIDEIDRQVAARQTEEQRLKSNALILQQRIDSVPTRETEMIELSRDYGTLTALYTGLLAKREESKIAANLLRRQIGEQFKLLDPARVAGEPFSPNRRQINLAGMAAGLVLGLGLIVLLEYRDSSFTTDDEVTSLLALPVLAVVPLMQSAEERRRGRRRRLFVGIGLGSTVAGCLAVLAYTFVR